MIPARTGTHFPPTTCLHLDDYSLSFLEIPSRFRHVLLVCLCRMSSSCLTITELLLIDDPSTMIQHELVMAVVTKKIRMYLFVMQVRSDAHSIYFFRKESLILGRCTDGSITADHHWSNQTLQRLPCARKRESLSALASLFAQLLMRACFRLTAVLLDWITEWFPLTRCLVRFPFPFPVLSFL